MPAGPTAAPAALLHWESVRRSASDELYHATWRTERGTTPVGVPPSVLSGSKLLSVNTALDPRDVTSESVLASVRVQRGDWETWLADNKQHK